MSKKQICTGILAHVDAGKTTLSEGLLYTSGSIRKIGRVDNKDAYLDNYELERARGITIFSKQAVMELEHTIMTLLDTPGHIDFSTEMERTLQVLDYAILVVSGADGVQGHTQTLWELLEHYHIPTFLFVNKMDQNGTDRGKLMEELQNRFGDGCIDFSGEWNEEFYETLAMQEEEVLNSFLEEGVIEQAQIQKLIKNRKVFPCFFGSALKLQGVEEFIHQLDVLTIEQPYPEKFGARVFKITRDEQGNRLTHLKVTGGSLKVKDIIIGNSTNGEDEESWEEKVNEIRIYSGEKYHTEKEVKAGTICAVTGLNHTFPGEGVGMEDELVLPYLTPVLTYQIVFPEGQDPASVLPKLSLLEEEDPSLHILWREDLQEIHIQVMGEVQIEILKSVIKERFGIMAEFAHGTICYKETIKNTVEGVGHFEPLRHYAEVHVMLEPLEAGAGLVFESNCSEDKLSRNWQRLILTHLKERQHRGVLTGSAVTDMKITLIAGRAHQKHTMGGDFRQATYRAVRQGLMEAESVLLEPYYEFRLEIPESYIGRAMTDIENMHGMFDSPERFGDMAVITGKAPVATFGEYQKQVNIYSKGCGKLSLRVKGYYPCHNEEEVIDEIAYEPEADLRNPTGSVFCAHGVGFYVEWDQVKNYMHVEAMGQEPQEETIVTAQSYYEEEWIDTEEVDRIIERTFYANRNGSGKSPKKSQSLKSRQKQKYPVESVRTFRETEKKEEYVLVDGYNVIFAWEELKELAKINVDSARGRLMDILCNYQGMKKCNLILVFDAYRVEGHPTEILDYHNIHVVYTKEAETADAYIEKFAHENGKKYHITVVTSDGLEQIIIRGAGCHLLSSRELQEEINQLNQKLTEYQETQTQTKNFLQDILPKGTVETFSQLLEEP